MAFNISVEDCGTEWVGKYTVRSQHFAARFSKEEFSRDEVPILMYLAAKNALDEQDEKDKQSRVRQLETEGKRLGRPRRYGNHR